LALIDNRWLLFKTALSTLLLGVAMIYSIGIILGLVNYDLPMTNEILSRTQPTILDLMIALAGGAAGAFASVSPRLSVAVVGVAVATALVPPLVASGILFAHMEWKNSANAFLLAVTNIFAIQISSSLVLWIAGFRRGSTEEVQSNVKEFLKRNAVSLMFLALLGIYLSLNFYALLNTRLYESSTEATISTELNHANNIIDTIQYDKKEGFTLVRVSIRGDIPPSPSQIIAMAITTIKHRTKAVGENKACKLCPICSCKKSCSPKMMSMASIRAMKQCNTDSASIMR
jgi:uncharacterized membrane protein